MKSSGPQPQTVPPVEDSGEKPVCPTKALLPWTQQLQGTPEVMDKTKTCTFEALPIGGVCQLKGLHPQLVAIKINTDHMFIVPANPSQAWIYSPNGEDDNPFLPTVRYVSPSTLITVYFGELGHFRHNSTTDVDEDNGVSIIDKPVRRMLRDRVIEIDKERQGMSQAQLEAQLDPLRAPLPGALPEPIVWPNRRDDLGEGPELPERPDPPDLRRRQLLQEAVERAAQILNENYG